MAGATTPMAPKPSRPSSWRRMGGTRTAGMLVLAALLLCQAGQQPCNSGHPSDAAASAGSHGGRASGASWMRGWWSGGGAVGTACAAQRRGLMAGAGLNTAAVPASSSDTDSGVKADSEDDDDDARSGVLPYVHAPEPPPRCLEPAGGRESSGAAGGSAAAGTATGAACRAFGASAGVDAEGWLTDLGMRRRAFRQMGDRSRLLAAARKYLDGGNLVISFTGGSITTGTGSMTAPPYMEWVRRILNASLPGNPDGRVELQMGAVSATSSSFMSVCHRKYVRADSDIIVIEYAINEQDPYRLLEPYINNVYRRYLERLIRQLLGYPRKPAVMLLNVFSWYKAAEPPGTHGRPNATFGHYWKTNERDFFELSQFYGLPTLSARGGMYHILRQGTRPGFMIDATYLGLVKALADKGQRMTPSDARYETRRLHYWDEAHPLGPGHRALGEIVAQAILDAVETASRRPMTFEELHSIDRPLPPPMLPGNHVSATDRCMLGDTLNEAVYEKDEHWQWINEARPGQQDKYGFVSTAPGSTIRFKVDTRSIRSQGLVDTGGGAPGAGGKPRPTRPSMHVFVAYLGSYEHMGMANISCVSGCTCHPTILDGHTPKSKVSVVYLHEVLTTESEECVVQAEVLQVTKSGEHKVKLSGLMVSEEELSNRGGGARDGFSRVGGHHRLLLSEAA